MNRRILICGATAQDGVLANKVLGAAGIESVVCSGLADVMARLQQGCGGLLLAEEVIRGPAMLPLRSWVKAQAAWSDLPILVLTVHGSDSLDAQRAVETLGNVTLLERPVRTIGLISAVRAALRARDRQYLVQLADQRKDEFLATLAHELRNPLAPIRTSVSIIAKLQPQPEVLRLTNTVERQVGHLTRLVDDLLDVARITTGKVVLQSQRSTVRAVLAHALEIAGAAVQEKGHKLTVTQPDGDHVLDADYARVVQSVANLVGNAAKFTPPGGEISVAVHVEGPVVQFRVRDNGKGIAHDSLESIFELFAQAPTPGEPSIGLGIGLNLAKRFAEMHGGSIGVASEGPGKGSEFTLTLPIVVPGEVAAALPASAAEPARTGVRRILVVDDNVDAAETLQTFLELEGFTVTLAFDGAAAVEAAVADAPDVILMDIGMPKMDGYEAARQIRAKTSGIKLFALTGWGQDLDRQKAESAGFDMHFVKPVDLQKLLAGLDSGS